MDDVFILLVRFPFKLLSLYQLGRISHFRYSVVRFIRFLHTGMMGSGKTTVGKILSEVLGYSFFDRFVFLLESRQMSELLEPFLK